MRHSTASFLFLMTISHLQYVYAKGSSLPTTKGKVDRVEKRVSVTMEPRFGREQKPELYSQYTDLINTGQAEIQGALPTADDRSMPRGFENGIEPSGDLLNEVLAESKERIDEGIDGYKSKEADEEYEGEERQKVLDTSTVKNVASQVKELQDNALKDALVTHNRLRALHHVKPLRWNESLAQQAQQTADMLAVDPSTFQGEAPGQNIAQIWHEQARAAVKATHIWYSENKLYSFAYPQFSDKVRHFTQLVWKSSRQLGLGAAQSPAGKYVIVVALYRPAGNGVTQMRDNVFQSGAERDVYATIKAKIPKP